MISQSLINKLKDKGVSADIILDLILDDEQNKPMNEKQDNPKTPAPETPAAQETPAAPETPAGQTQDVILQAINKLTGAIQASNIINTGSKGPETETSEAALAQLINPKGGK